MTAMAEKESLEPAAHAPPLRRTAAVRVTTHVVGSRAARAGPRQQASVESDRLCSPRGRSSGCRQILPGKSSGQGHVHPEIKA